MLGYQIFLSKTGADPSARVFEVFLIVLDGVSQSFALSHYRAIPLFITSPYNQPVVVATDRAIEGFC